MKVEILLGHGIQRRRGGSDALVIGRQKLLPHNIRIGSSSEHRRDRRRSARIARGGKGNYEGDALHRQPLHFLPIPASAATSFVSISYHFSRQISNKRTNNDRETFQTSSTWIARPGQLARIYIWTSIYNSWVYSIFIYIIYFYFIIL